MRVDSIYRIPPLGLGDGSMGWSTLLTQVMRTWAWITGIHVKSSMATYSLIQGWAVRNRRIINTAKMATISEFSEKACLTVILETLTEENP